MGAEAAFGTSLTKVNVHYLLIFPPCGCALVGEVGMEARVETYGALSNRYHLDFAGTIDRTRFQGRLRARNVR